jgi:glutamine synthetase
MGNNILVLCESWVWNDNEFKSMKPANTNFRHYAEKVFQTIENEVVWFGLEQEYSLIETKNKFSLIPLGWPHGGFPGAQGPYYCSVGAEYCFGRIVMESHYNACLYSGIMISGSNAEALPGQWEF